MGKHDDNAEKSYLRKQADDAQAAAAAATTKAAAPDPLEQRLIDKATALDDWESGKAGPIDIHNMPGGGAQIALYNDAITNTEAGRIGRGTASMTGGTNPNFVASLDHENELTRKLSASGALENQVNTALGNKDIMLGNLGAQGDARNMQIAGMQNQDSQNAQGRDLQWQTRPRPPGFLKSLALAAVGGGAGYGKVTA